MQIIELLSTSGQKGITDPMVIIHPLMATPVATYPPFPLRIVAGKWVWSCKEYKRFSGVGSKDLCFVYLPLDDLIFHLDSTLTRILIISRWPLLWGLTLNNLD